MLVVLTHGARNNGLGLAHQRFFRHEHGTESRRTSSSSRNDILRFDSENHDVKNPVALNSVKIC
jgi:hypothetical protein